MLKTAALILITSVISPSATQAKSFEIMNNPAKQGETVVVRINPQWQGSLVCVSAFGKHYVPNRNGYVFIGVSIYENPGKKIVFLVECGRGVRLDWYYDEIVIVRNKFSKTRTDSGGKSSRPRKNWERTAIDNAFSPANINVFDLTGGIDFLDPVSVESIIDPFGLIYRNNNTKPHFGVDLRVSMGTPVRSTNAGRVILVADDFSKEGNMVIINHGLGIFSVYMHLSQIGVKEGDAVAQNQVIGLSGETGAGVKEPHLHFSIKIHDTYVDPLRFIDIMNQYVK